MQKIVMMRVMREEQRSDNNYVSAEIRCNMFDKEMHVHRSSDKRTIYYCVSLIRFNHVQT